MSGASATFAPRRSGRGAKPKGSSRPAEAGLRAAARIRWDRLGRVAMLLVLVALVFLYLSAGAHMLSSWKQSRHDHATVAAMEREHLTLLRQHNLLSSQSNLEIQARQLDMMRPGERPYVVSHLPNN